jgi:hypothetical protein
MSEYKREPKLAALTAKDPIFLIPEIIEAILARLPPRDLLVNAQRVNHTWNAIIKSSPRIQQALFFESLSRNSNWEPEMNPLLEHAFPPWFQDPGKDDDIDQFWKLGAECFMTLDWNSSGKKRAAYARKEASWRWMLPVQPPARTLEIVKYAYSMKGSWRRTGKLYFKDGARMGTLYDLAQKEVAIPLTGFSIKWHSLHGSENEDEVSGVQNYLFGRSKNRVTMTVAWTEQGGIGRSEPLGPEFKSQAYEVLDIRLGN